MSFDARQFLASIAVGIFAALLGASASAHGPNVVEAAGPSVAMAPTESVAGTVEQLIVEDRVSGKTTRHVSLRLRDGSLLPLRGPDAVWLDAGAQVEVGGRRNGKALQIESAQIVAPAPKAAVQGGPTAMREGTLALLHADDFSSGTGTFLFELHESDGGRRSLELAALPETLRPGMRIAVEGRAARDGVSLTPERIVVLAAPTPKALTTNGIVAKAATINSVLVITAYFSGGTAPAFTAAQAQSVMTSVGNYYNEASFGQQQLSATVTPWVKMSIASTCDYNAIANAATAAATATSPLYDPSQYAFVVFLFPNSSQGGISCGWLGLGYVGYPHEAWINGTGAFTTKTVGHEMGHNFGLLHAASLDCGAAPIGGTCSVSEYGDPFDIMGNIGAMHFTAMQKSKLAWIPDTAVKTHTSGSITYDLTPIESGGGTSYAIKVPTANANRTYWIEYRQPIGFDGSLASYPNNGAQIRVANPFETMCGGCDSWSDDTQLLDMTPATSAFTDGALVVGQSFTDAINGVTINVLASTPSLLTVQVVKAGGAATATTLTSSLNPSMQGTTVTFTATVTGVSPTGTVAFTDGGAAISGCGAIALAGSGNSRTAQCATSALATATHSIVAAYSGDGSNASSTSTALSQVVNGKTTTTTALGSSVNPSNYGASVTFTATVTGASPTGTVAFTDGGAAISGCGAVALAGSGNSRTAQCATSALAAATHNLVATYGGDAANASSTSPVLSQVVNSSGGAIDVALASNGATISASSTLSAAYPASSLIDGNRAGTGWGNAGGWNDNTPNKFPDTLTIDFKRNRTIDRVVVYTLQDNFANPVEPSDAQTFSLYGVTGFTVQARVGSRWTTVATVSGNNLVKRTVTFAAKTTSKIRVRINRSVDGTSRLTEIEAWGQ